MANPATTKEFILAHVLAMLDASTGDENASWPVDSEDAAYNKLHALRKIEDAAADVAFAILTADNHPNRDQFMTEMGPYTNGTNLPTSIGTPGTCSVKKNAASIAPTEYVLAYPRNVQMVQTMRAKQIVVRHLYYAVTEAGDLYFTGLLDGVTDNSRAKIWLGIFDMATDVFWDGLSRDLHNWIACRALMTLQPRGGNVLGGAQYWAREWDRFLASVRNRMLAPEIQMPNQGGTP